MQPAGQQRIFSSGCQNARFGEKAGRTHVKRIPFAGSICPKSAAQENYMGTRRKTSFCRAVISVRGVPYRPSYAYVGDSVFGQHSGCPGISLTYKLTVELNSSVVCKSVCE